MSLSHGAKENILTTTYNSPDTKEKKRKTSEVMRSIRFSKLY